MSAGNGAQAQTASQHSPDHVSLSAGMVAFLAFCCGAVVANLYYAQPIIELIAPSIGLSTTHASLIVSITQLGYAAGLFFLVPLADLLENRRLVVGFTLLTSACLAAAGFAQSPSLFLAASLLIGLNTVAVQIIVPLAAHMTPEHLRGRVVGNIMSGLLLGILLSRPIASTLAQFFGWRGVFFSAAVVTLLIALVMVFTLPRRIPTHRASYTSLIASVFTLTRRFAVLRQRSAYHGLLFVSFSLFWTLSPIELIRQYGFTQTGLAIFALLGAIGTIAAPIAGRLADAGHSKKATTVALILAPLAMLLSTVPGTGYLGLVACAVVLDFAVQMNMVLGQRDVYSLDAHSRGRLNAVYMTSTFIGGAAGSLVASPLYEQFGWAPTATASAMLSAVALVLFVAREKR